MLSAAAFVWNQQTLQGPVIGTGLRRWGAECAAAPMDCCCCAPWRRGVCSGIAARLRLLKFKGTLVEVARSCLGGAIMEVAGCLPRVQVWRDVSYFQDLVRPE